MQPVEKTNEPLLIRARFLDASAAEAAADRLNRILGDLDDLVACVYKAGDGVAESSDIAAVYGMVGIDTEVGWDETEPFVCDGRVVSWVVPPKTGLVGVENLLAASGAVAIIVKPIASDEEAQWRELLPDTMKELLDSLGDGDEDDDAKGPSSGLTH